MNCPYFLDRLDKWMKMKSFRLIIIGAILFLAGVAGFLASFSQTTREKKVETPPAQMNGDGFLPMALPVERQLGAPTLQPQDNLTGTSPAGSTQAAGEPAVTELAPEITRTSRSPLIPDRIVIPKIELDAPVVSAGEKSVEISSEKFLQYLAPDKFAAGWHPDSAPLGEVGNTVINGHHNVHGKVFGRLVDLVPGDRIQVYSGDTAMIFQVSNVLILPERDADLATRLENARWIEPSKDVRLTLVTCWPEYSNTHRLIIVASVAPESLGQIERK